MIKNTKTNNTTNTKTKEKNSLIENRRRKKRIKKYILLTIILLSISVTLCLKLSYFNVKKIEVIDNRNIQSDEITRLSNIKLGKNIFYLNLKTSKKNILTNPYILNVEIKRKLPNNIKIYVKERTAVFYIKKGEQYLVIDENGVVLEEKASVKGMKLLRLDGFNDDLYKVGEIIKSKDTRKIKFISEITELIKRLKKDIPEPTIVDIGDLTDIKIIYGEMIIKLGTIDKFEEKYNKAINILMNKGLINKRGYIDVSFNGNPVFSIKN